MILTPRSLARAQIRNKSSRSSFKAHMSVCVSSVGTSDRRRTSRSVGAGQPGKATGVGWPERELVRYLDNPTRDCASGMRAVY
jgi:hypothetical protein